MPALTDVPAALLALLHAASAAESEVDAQLAAVGLSLPKLAALHHLVDAGQPLPLGQLADRLRCVKSNVTQLVDRLEADGLVARAPDPNDGRARLAVVTTLGRERYVEGARLQGEAERAFFGALSPEEADQLSVLIRKLGRRR